MAERRSVCLSVRCLLVYRAAVDLACNHDTYACRRKLKDVTDLLLYADGTDTSSSSEEDDLESIFLDVVFAPKRERGPRVNLEEIGDLECEQLFR